MDGLDEGVLSDRSAGRLLHTLVRRRRQLHQQRLNEKFIRLGETASRPAPGRYFRQGAP
jgi:hypothetical protein